MVKTMKTVELTWPETLFVIGGSLLAAWLADAQMSPGVFLAVGAAAFGTEVLMQRKQR